MRFATRSAIIALAIGASLCAGNANAQVQVFDSAPSVDQLRTILIPESKESASRSIIIKQVPKQPSQTQPASLTTPTIPAAQAPAAMPAAAPFMTPLPDSTVTIPAAPAKPKAPATTDHATAAVGFRINFAFNSADIPSDGVPLLDAIAELLRNEPKLVLRVEGHTDAVGSAQYNLELSARRAAAVASYLAEHGVTKDQLLAVGKGKSEPLVSDPFDGRNRRVQFNRVSFESAAS